MSSADVCVRCLLIGAISDHRQRSAHTGQRWQEDRVQSELCMVLDIQCMRSIVLWDTINISMSLSSVLIQSHYSWLYMCPFLQYYDDSFPTLKEQTKFEESLFNKIRRSNGMCLVILVCILSLSLCVSSSLFSVSRWDHNAWRSDCRLQEQCRFILLCPWGSEWKRGKT